MPVSSEGVGGNKVSQGDKYARARQPKACRCHFTICYSPSHWSFLSHFFSAFSDYIRGRGDGGIALQHRLFTAPSAWIQTFVGESIIHLSLAISAITLSILWFAYHGAFPCFPFAPILIMLCHKHEDYEIFLVSTWSRLGGYLFFFFF